MNSRKLRIAIIGAGPGGLCMGKRLLDEGFDDFVILERAEDVGGVWLANRYPGCETDTLTISYAFSFETKTDWSKFYCTQPEILDYLRKIADKYDLRKHCQFNSGVASAEWHETTSSWTLTLDSSETIEAEVVISAMGMFSKPKWPQITGLEKFKGAMWHTTQWNDNHDLSSDRIAVIGSGASSIQLIPEVVKIAPQVYLFQRTPNWLQQRHDKPDSNGRYRSILNNPEFYNEVRANIEQRYINVFVNFSDPKKLAELEAIGLAAIDVVKDPEVRQKLRPTYPIGRTRIAQSNSYYSAFNEPNLELVTEPIERIKSYSIVTSDGKDRDIDTIILATGFELPKFLSAIEVIGRNGQSIETAWPEGPMAYLGVMTSGFPNWFMVFGPNTYNGSAPNMIEIQVDYILKHLHHMANDGLASIDVKRNVMLRYDKEIQQKFKNQEWMKKSSYYNFHEPKVRNFRYWPYAMDEYRRRTATIDYDAFSLTEVGNKQHRDYSKRRQVVTNK